MTNEEKKAEAAADLVVMEAALEIAIRRWNSDSRRYDDSAFRSLQDSLTDAISFLQEAAK